MGSEVAWFGLVVIASIVLLAGAILKMRRRRKPYSNKFDLQEPMMGSPADYNESALAAPPNRALKSVLFGGSTTLRVTRQAEDLEKIAQGLGERWSQQFQEQAEAAVETLRVEVKIWGRWWRRALCNWPAWSRRSWRPSARLPRTNTASKWRKHYRSMRR